jgi:hypothetical protein
VIQAAGAEDLPYRHTAAVIRAAAAGRGRRAGDADAALWQLGAPRAERVQVAWPGINTAPSPDEVRRTPVISRPQTLQIHLPHGDPARIRMAEITTRSGHETVTFEPARGRGL